ncbi:purple acid phosphatase family protein [Nocardioides sp. DS6]|uniref:Purple acid phosphatase family protein n=1 Tax=Nocardioides eburneus TaxID=3231482 RepID=A0ABV3T017_9ACTN
MTDTTTPVSGPSPSTQGSDFSRRSLLAALGATGAAATLGLVPGSADAQPAGSVAPAAHTGHSPVPSPSPTPAAPVPPVAGLHVTFGADPTTSASVTWHALETVKNPRVLIAKDGGAYEQTVRAVAASYTDAKSGTLVHAYHARATRLRPDTAYVYLAVHDGAAPEFGTFRTAPKGRQAFRFTSFGDQGTPTMGKQVNGTYVNDNLGSPAAGDTTAGVESLSPLLHLFNGDLCYANLATDRVRTWSDFWNNNTRSARHRAWMPSPGNHEDELGNGPIGYAAYQTYFDLPRQAGQTDVTRGLWYALTVGAVRFVFLANDDVCYQDGGDNYVRGYSNGAQKAWLEKTLKAARADRDIDWIVVCMHQVAISTANNFNGADLGIREEWLPVFDEYGVDLVVCGHEHHYERSKAIRGQQDNQTRTPIPTVDALDVVDTTKGTVHMVIGGGGTSAPSNQLLFDPPRCRVIVSVSAPPAGGGKRTPTYVREDAVWSGTRDAAHSYGFAAFDVDPGDAPGGLTSIKVTYYEVSGPYGALTPFETFTLQRPRRDGRR